MEAHLENASFYKAQLPRRQPRPGEPPRRRPQGGDPPRSHPPLREPPRLYANLRGADLRGTNLQDADLGGANLRGARYDAGTVWPEGFDPDAAGAIRDEDDEKLGSVHPPPSLWPFTSGR
jgi:hypothetical protein